MAIQRFCTNDTVNLILSSFAEKAKQQGIRLTVQASLPEKLPVTDMELCALLSNSLENALNAAAPLPVENRWVQCRCGIRRNKLLLEVKNPYQGEITLEGGLPTSAAPGHGFGCRSIRAIAQQHGGLYTFQPEKGIFTLQVAIPIS